MKNIKRNSRTTRPPATGGGSAAASACRRAGPAPPEKEPRRRPPASGPQPSAPLPPSASPARRGSAERAVSRPPPSSTCVSAAISVRLVTSTAFCPPTPPGAQASAPRLLPSLRHPLPAAHGHHHLHGRRSSVPVRPCCASPAQSCDARRRLLLKELRPSVPVRKVTEPPLLLLAYSSDDEWSNKDSVQPSCVKEALFAVGVILRRRRRRSSVQLTPAAAKCTWNTTSCCPLLIQSASPNELARIRNNAY